jgi:NADPH-dependent 2,4-dienoyl-CoA reductase/sulfur reductase-like enzyme
MTVSSVLTCDIAIVGAGPAGLAAARAAATVSRSIIIIDDNPYPGGQIWRDGPQVKLPDAAREYRDILSASNVRYLPATRIIASPKAGALLLEDAKSSYRLDYEQLILCCGARELLLPFPGWTLPGVTGVGGLQALVKSGMPVAGERVVIAGSGPLLLASAQTARAACAHVSGLYEQAASQQVLRFALSLARWPSKLVQAFTLFDVRYRWDSYVVEALGETTLEAVRVCRNGREETVRCDRLACGFGLTPNTVLASHLGCRLEEQAIAVDSFQQTSRLEHYAAGECTGIGGSELALVEGRIAGLAASGQWDEAQALFGQRAFWQAFAQRVQQCFKLRSEVRQLARPDTLICRCEDVPFSALMGEQGWNAAKLQSRCGMGACQGRICGTATRELLGWPLPEPRIPLAPARIETLMTCSDNAPS